MPRSIDSTDLTHLIERVAPDLLAYFERRVDPEDAADLLGETLLVAWRRASVLPRRHEHARMWLFGVAKGVLNNHARGVRRRLRLADALRDEVTRAHRQTARDNEHSDVIEAIEALPDDLAELVRLIHWDGFRLVEAATLMGINPSTARGRYAKAKELLRRSLRPPPLVTEVAASERSGPSTAGGN